MGVGASQDASRCSREAGALPDFVVLGTQKGGTTSLYDVLTRHPHVEPAILRKEIHYFTLFFRNGIGWYRCCFPQPRWVEGRRTTTGEATPYYLFHPDAASRAAAAIPQARLIALLRNPVDRAYSHYQMVRALGRETLTFEKALEAEEGRLRGAEEKMLQDEFYVSPAHQYFSYLSRGVYVDQLRRWSRFFGQEQMLVLKSEDFFERPADVLKVVLDFLGLPAWQPEAWRVLHKGKYERQLDPVTRRRLQDYFEPHNRRLYDYLGVDFRW